MPAREIQTYQTVSDFITALKAHHIYYVRAMPDIAYYLRTIDKEISAALFWAIEQ